MKLKDLTAIAATGALILSLTACNSDKDSASEKTSAAQATTSASATPSPTTKTPTPKASSESASPSSSHKRVDIGTTPSWAANPVNVGTLIGTTYTDSWQIDIFQVGTAQASPDSNWTDSATGDNLLPGGSPIVILNFVYTNISGAPITVGSTLGTQSFRTDEWKYSDDMPSEDRDEHFQPFGLANRVFNYDAVPDISTASLPVAPGESVAKPTTVLYTPGMKLKVKVFISPVDAQGKVDSSHSEKSEDNFSVVVK